MKNLIENFNEFRKTKNGKPILFFGFYLLFFIFVFLLIKFEGNKDFLNQEYEKGRSSQFNSSLLLGKNYYYDYKINIDGVLHDYYGKRNQDIESFKYNNNEYYRNGDDFFINNGMWVKCDNPYIFYEIIDVDNLSDIINNSTIMSNDGAGEGKKVYKYVISTNTINKLIYNVESDYDEVPNDLDITLDNNNGSIVVKLTLNSFCKLNNVCNDSLVVEANYEMFNSVRDIDNPIK